MNNNLFCLEQELVSAFISCIDSNSFEIQFLSYSHEFNFQNGKTDIIAKKSNNDVVAFEAKLRDIKKVINQAYRNTAFANFSYIVLPASKQKLQKKYHSEMDRMNIGVILVDRQHAWIEKQANEVIPVLSWLHKKANCILSKNGDCANV